MEKIIPTIEYNKSTVDAAKLIIEKNSGFVIILQNKKPIGIITENDYMKKIITKNKLALEVPLKDIMSYKIHSVKPYTEIENAIQKMLNNNIKSLLVFENNEIIGVVTQVGLASYLRNKLLIDSTIKKIDSSKT